MDYKSFWLSILRRLEPTITRAKFLTWFANTAVLGVAGEHLTVGVPTAFARDWLSSKYAVKILQAAQEIEPAIKEIEFAVDAVLADGSDPRTINIAANFAQPNDKKIRRVAGSTEVRVTSGGLRSGILNPRYTLQNFVAGDENRLAHAASLSVARLPGQTYNPLFIYGGVGLGKTHLLSAIGHEVLTNDPSKVVCYITADRFTSEYVDAVQRRKVDDFRRRYRDADVFLLDDVQFLEGREQTQTEFFNVFNQLHGAGKQICVTSDRPPSELTEIMDRLRSRLTWGLVAEVEQPSYTSRLAILTSKAREHRAIVDPEILDFIAKNVTDSIRALEGILTTTLAEADLLASQPTIRSVGRLLAKLNKKERVVGLPETIPTKVRSTDDLVALVASHFGLTSTQLASESREKHIKTARGIAMYLIRETMGQGLETIGQTFHRTHATVLHAVSKIKNDLARDAQLVGHVNAVKKEMGL